MLHFPHKIHTFTGELAQTTSYLQLERATSPYTAHTEKLLRDISKINNQAQQKISLENPDYFKAFQPVSDKYMHMCMCNDNFSVV